MRDPLLVTMNAPMGKSAPTFLETIQALDDWNAGVVALGIIGAQNPGLKMSDLPNLGQESMAGLFDFVGRQVSNLGGVAMTAVRTTGGLLGDGVRLLTDEKVVDGASKLASAGSSAYSGIPGGDSLQSFIQALGSTFKGDAAATPGAGGGSVPSWVPWAAGGAGVLVLVLLLRPQGGGRR